MRKMKEITAYKTAMSMASSDLDKQVSKYIGEGWQPYGTPYRQQYFCCQAMVRYKGEK